MSRLPRVTARDMVRVLKRAGFVLLRISASHHLFQHHSDPARRTTVAMHPGDLSKEDLHDILKQAKISREEFMKLR